MLLPASIEKSVGYTSVTLSSKVTRKLILVDEIPFNSGRHVSVGELMSIAVAFGAVPMAGQAGS